VTTNLGYQPGTSYQGIVPLQPILQRADGSYIGTVGTSTGNSMIAFTSTGRLVWPGQNDTPQIATSDGGVIGASGTTYDQYGNADGQTAIGITQSWTGNAYQGPAVTQVASAPTDLTTSYAAVSGGNPSAAANLLATASMTFVQTYSAPQEGLYALATTKLKAAPQCDDLLSRLASIKHVTESTLITQLQQTASGSRDYIYEGTNNPTELTQAKFPGVATAEVNTVGLWFDVDAGRDALSQFNGYAIFLRLDAWHSWLGGYFSSFLINKTGKVNYYGMGTLMHETLHKQSVGGGVSHCDMDNALGVACDHLQENHNVESDLIGQRCFGNLK
jgi:hypothetical protein